MNLQNDIFDVARALKGKPEAKAFQRICDALDRAESAWDHYQSLTASIYSGMTALKEIWDEGQKE